MKYSELHPDENKLATAKKVLGTEQVFLNGNHRLNFYSGGKYRPNMTFVIQNDFNIDEKGRPVSPLEDYIVDARSSEPTRKYLDGMNIDFDGDKSILFGNYHISKNGNPVFEICEPQKAGDVLVTVSWGGPFDSSRGASKEYAKDCGAEYFRIASSNGGGAGNDYWVLPVGHVAHEESLRDVSATLKQISDEIHHGIQEREDKYKQGMEHAAKQRKSIEQLRSQRMSYMRSAVERLNKAYEAIGFPQNMFTVVKDEIRESQYNQDPEYIVRVEATDKENYKGYSANNNDLKDWIINQGHNFTFENGEIIPDWFGHDIEQAISDAIYFKEHHEIYEKLEKDYNIHMTFKLGNTGIELHDVREAINDWHDLMNFPFTDEGLNQIKGIVSEHQKNLEKEKLEQIRAELERQKQLENMKKDEAGKAAGLPENYSHWHRTGGATNLGEVYVIEPDGSFRDPIDNVLRNENHRHFSDWLHTADGTQVFGQIHTDEVVIGMTKEMTREPFVVTCDFLPEEMTEDQWNALKSVSTWQKDIDKQYPDGQATMSGYRGYPAVVPTESVIDAVREKAEEMKQEGKAVDIS